MRVPTTIGVLGLTFAAALAVTSAAEAQPRGRSTATATELCPQIKRTPVRRLNQFPALVRKALGHMAEVNGRWNVGDAIGPGETHLPFRHLIAGGDMGKGRWLVIWEQGGFAHFTNVEVYQLIRPGARAEIRKVAHASGGGDLQALCRQVAAELRGR